MRHVIHTTINAPVEQVSVLLANPANNPKWMVNLSEYAPLDGVLGQVGSTYKLTFGEGAGAMPFTVTILARELPHKLQLQMANPKVEVRATATFTALNPTQTQYVSDQTFVFKGFGNKLFGFMASPSIKRQQRRDMEAFKAFAERTLG